MATYLELEELATDGPLNRRTAIAVAVAASNVRTATATGDLPPANQALRLAWAKEALTDIRAMASAMLPGVLGENKDLSVAAIQGASDNALQANVEDYIDIFADN